jgi:hypothetical protein
LSGTSCSSFQDKIKSSWLYTLAVTIIGFISLWVRTLPSDGVLFPCGQVRIYVPYPTEDPIAGEIQFDTAPVGPDVVSYGDTTKEVRVSEEAVLNGDEIKIQEETI